MSSLSNPIAISEIMQRQARHHSVLKWGTSGAMPVGVYSIAAS